MRLQEQFLSSLAVGQLVMRRMTGGVWGAGFVTRLSPLEVTASSTDPCGKARALWDEVRAPTEDRDAEFIRVATSEFVDEVLENAYEIDKQRHRSCPDDPVKLLPNVCVSTVYTMYDTAADGASLQKRVPEAYHAWPEATVTSECTKTVTNTVIIGCHINLEDSTVAFKTHSGTESESHSTRIPTTAKQVCPLISVWDASCKITLNMGERDFEYPEFAVRVPDTMPYRDSIKGTLQ